MEDDSTYLCEAIINSCKKEKKANLVLDNCKLQIMPNDMNSMVYVTKLDLSNNFIDKINGSMLPPNLKSLNLSNNKLITIDLSTFPKTINELKMNNCKLIIIKGLNTCYNLHAFYCSNNNINSFPQLPMNLIKFVANNCSIKEFIGDFPEDLENVSLNNNLITKFPNFSNNIITLSMDHNEIEIIDELPDNLQKLYMGMNSIHIINCCFPTSLEEIWLQHNDLSELPELPNGLVRCDISYNSITEIKYIPGELEEFDVSYNKLSTLPPEIYDQNVNVKSDGNYIDCLYNDTGNDNTCDIYNHNITNNTNIGATDIFTSSGNICATDIFTSSGNISPVSSNSPSIMTDIFDKQVFQSSDEEKKETIYEQFSGAGHSINNTYYNYSQNLNKTSQLDREINSNIKNPYYIVPTVYMKL